MTPAARPSIDRDVLVEDVRTLVETESSSRDLAALAHCREVLERLVVDRLGEPDARRLHDLSARGTGDVLELTYAGDAPGSVLLVGHYDTVWPTGTCDAWRMGPVDGSDGDLLTGPGSVDMKAGLVVAIHALALARQDGPVPTVTFLFNGDEEIGSIGSRDTIVDVASRHDASLVFEGAADGAVKSGRKGIGIFTVTCHGVESHAGNFPERGASAISAMAELVPQLDAMARPEAGTTVNVGMISGGSGANVVAGRCTATIDIRVTDPAEQDRIDAALAQLRVSDERVRIEIADGWNRPPMSLNEASRPLLQELRDAAASLGRDLRDVSVGGGSDANFISAAGGAVVCGLGPSGGGPHARDEHIDVASMLEQTALVRAFLSRRAR